LPRFVGVPAGALRMAAEYPGIVAALAPVGNSVQELHLSPRGAWQVVLDNGMLLELGRGDIAPRLAQFAATWPRLAAEGVETKHVDLRYANGLAVQRVAAAPTATQNSARPKAAKKP
ncbi:MAG TPA: cell division protein FtsQ/DivIB, partial [Usitatibacter sp.]